MENPAKPSNPAAFARGGGGVREYSAGAPRPNAPRGAPGTPQPTNLAMAGTRQEHGRNTAGTRQEHGRNTRNPATA